MSNSNTIKHFDDEGRLHNENGPAIEWADGSTEWWLHGCLHRLDGPAIYTIGEVSELWWLRGRIHRTDGPAVTNTDDSKEYWINGKQFDEFGYWYRIMLLG